MRRLALTRAYGRDGGGVAAMPTLSPSVRIYLEAEPVDVSRGHDGLAAIVHNQWKPDLYGGHLLAFIGRRGDRCKMLLFDRGGSIPSYNPPAKMQEVRQ